MIALQVEQQVSKQATQLSRFMKWLMSTYGISDRKLAIASGFKKTMVNEIANGRKVPSREKVPELAAGISKLAGIVVKPEEIEYLIWVDAWKKMLNDVTPENAVKHQELIDLIEARRQQLGELDFVKRCNAYEVRPEELKAAQEGYLPNWEALGPVAGLLDVSMDELVKYVCSPRCSPDCDHSEAAVDA